MLPEQLKHINFVQNPPFFSSNLFFSTFSLVLFQSLLFGDLFTLYTLNSVSSLPYTCKFGSGGAFCPISHLPALSTTSCKVAHSLFKYHLHINAARELAGQHIL